MRKVNFTTSLVLVIGSLLSAGIAFAQRDQAPTGPAAAVAATDTPAAPADAMSMNQIIERIIGSEAILISKMRGMHPLVETYLQNLDKDAELAFHPTSDSYFLGKLDYSAQDGAFTLLKSSGLGGIAHAINYELAPLYSVQYLPGGFADMLVLAGHFDKQNYNIEYVRREFLGEVRTLVFDVTPKRGSLGTFKGRIWAEDQDYNVVRFNGTYGPSSATRLYFHFDSWREYMGDGQWLPASVYTEESDISYLANSRHLRFKGQMRLWGYDVSKASSQKELTALAIESDQVKDSVEDPASASPVAGLRAWERRAEDNVIERLEKAMLLAPDGEVNKVLETVITNLQVTNNLDIQPEVRARVLLTSPLESFTIGHTIVLSRGLLDVLPDEASLAMILAHELAHIALGHRLDTKYAFNDRMFFEDPETFQQVHLKRDAKEEIDADLKAAELLKNSPYKDKLGNAGLFLEAVDARASKLNHLLLPLMGNSMVKGSQIQRMAGLKQGAPKLEMSRVDQIAALPLGGRVRVDPWSGKIEMLKSKPLPLLSAREKMPFEVTPLYLYLTRQTGTRQTASAEPAKTSSTKE